MAPRSAASRHASRGRPRRPGAHRPVRPRPRHSVIDTAVPWQCIYERDLQVLPLTPRRSALRSCCWLGTMDFCKSVPCCEASAPAPRRSRWTKAHRHRPGLLSAGTPAGAPPPKKKQTRELKRTATAAAAAGQAENNPKRRKRSKPVTRHEDTTASTAGGRHYRHAACILIAAFWFARGLGAAHAVPGWMKCAATELAGQKPLIPARAHTQRQHTAAGRGTSTLCAL